jgi:hypothetical protein
MNKVRMPQRMVRSGRLVVFASALSFIGCSGGDSLVAPVQPEPGSTDIAPAAPETAKIDGVLLAEVDVSTTHRIEFWELARGGVALLQMFDSSAGEVPIDLPGLVTQNGSYGAAYRTLVADPNAALSAELVAADEHFHALPIRDAALPLPTDAPPIAAGRSGPALAAGGSATPKLEPGQVRTLAGTPTVTFFGYGTAATAGFHCPGVEFDGGFCPNWGTAPDTSMGFVSGFANGSVQESINWGAIGSNPSWNTSGDTFTVNEWVSGAWHRDITVPISPGRSLVMSIFNVPTFYQGSITGSAVGYGDHFQLSFPQLRAMPTYPNPADNEFGNDIQGLTHDASNWILSRTDYPILGSNYGCLGMLSFATTLATDPGSCPVSITNPGAFNHFGDLVFNPHTGLTYVSVNQTGSTNGGIGVFTMGPSPAFWGFIIEEPGDQVAWLAHNPKFDRVEGRFSKDLFYTSNSAGTVLHQYLLSMNSAHQFEGNGKLSDIGIGNAASDYNIQGGKVSSHGKLWVYASVGPTLHKILGINPITGLIGASYSIPVSQAGWCCTGEEAEGLDITEFATGAPGIAGQIHFMDLGNRSLSNDQWVLNHYEVSDLSRL